MHPTVAPRSPAARRVAGHVAATSAVLVLGTLPIARTGGPPALDVLPVNVVAALILLARHRSPVGVLGAQLLLAVVSLPLGVLSQGTVIATAIAVHSVTLRSTRERSVPVTLLVALAVLVLAWADGDPAPQPALVVLLAGAIGDAIRTQRAHVAAATERAERAERTREALARERVAEERLSIARDLHDVVAHQIAVINLHAGVATSALRDRPDDAEASLALIRRASRTVLTEIGDMLATLRDPDADPADSGPLGLADLDDVVRRFTRDGLDVAVRVEGDPYPLPGATDITALRILAEALTNAHKHGADGRADVVLRFGPHALHLAVANPDRGTGSRADGDLDTVPGTRQGLVGVRERVESVRGTLRYGADGGTWVLAADLPAEPPDAVPSDAAAPADAGPSDHGSGG